MKTAIANILMFIGATILTAAIMGASISVLTAFEAFVSVIVAAIPFAGGVFIKNKK